MRRAFLVLVPRIGFFVAICALVGMVLGDINRADAQQATVTSPMRSTQSSFFEQTGAAWSLQGKNWFATSGNMGLATPQFGGYQPGAGLSSGWAHNRGDLTSRFGFSASQGSQRSFTGQSGSVTVLNGATGYVSDTSQSPFVMGFVPVVGAYVPIVPMTAPPVSATPPAWQRSPELQQALGQIKASREGSANTPAVDAPQNAQVPAKRPAQDDLTFVPGKRNAAEGGLAGSAGSGSLRSSAEVAVPSVAQARRLHAAEQGGDRAKALADLQRGTFAEKDGRLGVAKAYYQNALGNAPNDLKAEIRRRIESLEAARKAAVHEIASPVPTSSKTPTKSARGPVSF